jgi:hypothetical protein
MLAWADLDHAVPAGGAGDARDGSAGDQPWN